MNSCRSTLLILLSISTSCLIHQVISSTIISNAEPSLTRRTIHDETPSRRENSSKNNAPNFSSNTNKNATNTDDIWILMPNNMSELQFNRARFDLFKLNTEQLFSSLNEPEEFSPEEAPMSSSSLEMDQEPLQPTSDEVGHGDGAIRSRRESRKMKFFPNFMKKPKVSPLYLVNGTVCRFVNAQPICTTLSTTGLFGGNMIRPGSNSGGFINGLLPGQQQQLNNQFQQQGQQQGGLQRQTNPNLQPNFGPRF